MGNNWPPGGGEPNDSLIADYESPETSDRQVGRVVVVKSSVGCNIPEDRKKKKALAASCCFVPSASRVESQGSDAHVTLHHPHAVSMSEDALFYRSTPPPLSGRVPPRHPADVLLRKVRFFSSTAPHASLPLPLARPHLGAKTVGALGDPRDAFVRLSRVAVVGLALRHPPHPPQPT